MRSLNRNAIALLIVSIFLVAVILSIAAPLDLPEIRDQTLTKDELNLVRVLRGERADRGRAVEALNRLEVIVVTYKYKGVVTDATRAWAEKRYRNAFGMGRIEEEQSDHLGAVIANFRLVASDFQIDNNRMEKQLHLYATAFRMSSLGAKGDDYDPNAVLTYLEGQQHFGFFATSAMLVQNPDAGQLKKTEQLQAKCIDDLTNRIRLDSRFVRLFGDAIQSEDWSGDKGWGHDPESFQFKIFSAGTLPNPSKYGPKSAVSLSTRQASVHIVASSGSSTFLGYPIILRKQGLMIAFWFADRGTGIDPLDGDLKRWCQESLEPLLAFERELGAEPVAVGQYGEAVSTVSALWDNSWYW